MVRHCEAEGNVKRIFQGISDLDITELGAKQLKYLEKRFENIPLDKIYSSPLIRTQKTAAAVKGTKDIEIEINDGLIFPFSQGAENKILFPKGKGEK